MKMRIAVLSAVAALALLAVGCDSTVSVPDVTGMSVAESSEAVADAGLALGTVTEQSSDEVAVGLVIAQIPAADEEAAAGSAVALVVSTGPALVTVPDVLGMYTDEAAAMLEAVGLVPEEYMGNVATDQDASNADVGQIYRQTPEAGSEVPKGTPVEIRYWNRSG